MTTKQAAVLDAAIDRASTLRAMRTTAIEAGCTARVVGVEREDGIYTPDHLLVISPDGDVRTFTDSVALEAWLSR